MSKAAAPAEVVNSMYIACSNPPCQERGVNDCACRVAKYCSARCLGEDAARHKGLCGHLTTGLQDRCFALLQTTHGFQALHYLSDNLSEEVYNLLCDINDGFDPKKSLPIQSMGYSKAADGSVDLNLYAGPSDPFKQRFAASPAYTAHAEQIWSETQAQAKAGKMTVVCQKADAIAVIVVGLKSTEKAGPTPGAGAAAAAAPAPGPSAPSSAQVDPNARGKK